MKKKNLKIYHMCVVSYSQLSLLMQKKIIESFGTYFP